MKKLPVFLALDVETKAQALDLVKQTKDYVLGYKIGPRLFLLYGPSVIEEIKNFSTSQVFLDFKFYDIPSSTLEGIRSAFQIGADFATVHASIGKKTLGLLYQFEKEAKQKKFFQILCVTVLSNIQNSQDNQSSVLELADQVYQSGLRGLVSSPWEAKVLKQKYPDIFLMTPGIRWEGDSKDDQKRIMTPHQAIQTGSSALVIGRSLIQAKNPLEMLKSLSESLQPGEWRKTDKNLL